jgi:hypothetical protein
MQLTELRARRDEASRLERTVCTARHQAWRDACAPQSLCQVRKAAQPGTDCEACCGLAATAATWPVDLCSCKGAAGRSGSNLFLVQGLQYVRVCPQQ